MGYEHVARQWKVVIDYFGVAMFALTIFFEIRKLSFHVLRFYPANYSLEIVLLRYIVSLFYL